LDDVLSVLLNICILNNDSFQFLSTGEYILLLW
jgi:hypothetical protein